MQFVPYSAKAIANWFLQTAGTEGVSLSPMKLQKLVYYAHGWYLALAKAPLIREPVQAWPFGPVIPTLYREFNQFGNEPITRLATDLALNGTTFEEVTPQVSPEDAETRGFLARIWEVYKGYSAIQLSNMTHEPGTPWSQVAQQYPQGLPKSVAIPPEAISSYFAGLLKEPATAATK